MVQNKPKRDLKVSKGLELSEGIKNSEIFRDVF